MQSLKGNFTVFALTIWGEGHVGSVSAHHRDVQRAHVEVHVLVDPEGKLAEQLLMLAGENLVEANFNFTFASFCKFL